MSLRPLVIKYLLIALLVSLLCAGCGTEAGNPNDDEENPQQSDNETTQEKLDVGDETQDTESSNDPGPVVGADNSASEFPQQCFYEASWLVPTSERLAGEFSLSFEGNEGVGNTVFPVTVFRGSEGLGTYPAVKGLFAGSMTWVVNSTPSCSVSISVSEEQAMMHLVLTFNLVSQEL